MKALDEAKDKAVNKQLEQLRFIISKKTQLYDSLMQIESETAKVNEIAAKQLLSIPKLEKEKKTLETKKEPVRPTSNFPVKREPKLAEVPALKAGGGKKVKDKKVSSREEGEEFLLGLEKTRLGLEKTRQFEEEAFIRSLLGKSARDLFELYMQHRIEKPDQASRCFDAIVAGEDSAVKLELAKFLKSAGDFDTAHSLFHELADKRDLEAILEDAGYHLREGEAFDNRMRVMFLLTRAASQGDWKAAFFAGAFRLIMSSMDDKFQITVENMAAEIEKLNAALGRLEGISDSAKVLGRFICCEYGSYVLAYRMEKKEATFVFTVSESTRMLKIKERALRDIVKRRESVIEDNLEKIIVQSWDALGILKGKEAELAKTDLTGNERVYDDDIELYKLLPWKWPAVSE